MKKLSGNSFSEILQEKRIKIAAEKLLNTDFAIEKVISDVGYENKGYFRKLFVKKYGKNPLEFRKKGAR